MKLIQRQIKPKGSKIEIIINPENPYFAVRKVNVNFPNQFQKIGDIAIIKFTASKANNETTTYDIKVSNGMGIFFNELEKYFQPFNDASFQKVTLELLHFDPDDELSIDFEIQLGRDLLEMKKPWQEFNDHISNPVNTKIFFSAPFGQGKTTFLNEFFKQEKETYEVFRIFPVNYSVASNQDIFRYIKADLLYQLVVDKVSEFDKLDASYLKTIPTFIKKNPDKILAPFLMLIPEVGKNIFSFYEKIKTVTDSFVDFHDGESKDDNKEVDSFLQKLLHEEGSIYEDNLLTQIIRQQVKSINSKKKSVLLIDDLDRLDPDHTFRILNIISAHYDIYQNSDSTDYNKFGFDKIVVVCDIDNIQNIFEHRYGARANFSGYINKFYSTSSFKYENKRIMFSITDTLIDFQVQGKRPEKYYYALNTILRNFIGADQISLRDLIKLSKSSLEYHIRFLNSAYARGFDHYKYGLCTPILSFLSDLYDKNALLSMVEKSRTIDGLSSSARLTDVCWDLLIAIANNSRDKNKRGPHEITFNNKTYSLIIGSEFFTDRLQIEGGTCDGENINIIGTNFSQKDYYDLLEENIKWYFRFQNEWQLNGDN